MASCGSSCPTGPRRKRRRNRAEGAEVDGPPAPVETLSRTAQAVARAIQHEVPEPLTVLRPEAPAELQRIVAKAPHTIVDEGFRQGLRP